VPDASSLEYLLHTVTVTEILFWISKDMSRLEGRLLQAFTPASQIVA
jgi:hypothetical protein